MIAAAPNHIRIADDGRAWVDDTNVKVSEVVLSYLAAEGSIPWLVENYPHLTPARIHASMAWYYDHKEEVDRQIEAEDALVKRLAEEAGVSPLVQRLRAQREVAG